MVGPVQEADGLPRWSGVPGACCYERPGSLSLAAVAAVVAAAVAAAAAVVAVADAVADAVAAAAAVAAPAAYAVVAARPVFAHPAVPVPWLLPAGAADFLQPIPPLPVDR